MERISFPTAVVFIVCLALLAVPVSAFATSASPSSNDDSIVYRIGINQDYDGINPFDSWSTISWECFELGYNFLTWYDEEYKPAPDLATSWDVSEDGHTWTFHVREGMTWQDGLPLTAGDIAFTYNLIIDTRHWAYIQYLIGVTKVTAPDDATLIVETEAPGRMLAAGSGIPILPQHIWKNADPANLEGFKNMPFVGSGPFRVAEMKKSKWVKLEANRDYPQELGGPPTVDELIFVISVSTDSMTQEYKSGGLDAIIGYPATNREMLANSPGTTAVAAPAIGFHQLGFNCWDSPKSKGNPLLRDAAIRQAIHWAIDKTAITAVSMAGLATPGTSLVSPLAGDWHWDVPSDEQYRHDPAKAKQILDEAGYIDRDGDGVREAPNGRRLDFRLVALNEYPEDQTAAKMIVSWCRDIGIRVRLEQKDEGAFVDDVYQTDYDMFMWFMVGDIDPSFLLSLFTTEQINKGGNTGYSDPDFDRLFVEQAAAADRSKRISIVDEMQKILYRDNPIIALWYRVNLQAFRTDRWTGYVQVPPPHGAAFVNYLKNTYIDLKPAAASESAKGAGHSSLWITAGVIVTAVVLLVFFFMRRRPRAVEDD